MKIKKYKISFEISIDEFYNIEELYSFNVSFCPSKDRKKLEACLLINPLDICKFTKFTLDPQIEKKEIKNGYIS